MECSLNQVAKTWAKTPRDKKETGWVTVLQAFNPALGRQTQADLCWRPAWSTEFQDSQTTQRDLVFKKKRRRKEKKTAH